MQPDSVGRPLTARARGLITYLNSPEAQIITAAAIFYCATNVILSQNFCLFFRYSAIREDKKLHRIYTTTRSKFTCFLFGQLISLALSVFAYKTIVRPEVLSKSFSVFWI